MIDLDLPSPVRESLPLRSPGPAPILAVVLLAVLALGGSTGRAPGLDLVFSVPAGSGGFRMSSSALFIVDTAAAGDDETTIRRHSLTDGSLTWSAVVPQATDEVTPVESARVLIVTSRTGDIPEYSFVDADTGRLLWRRAVAGTYITRVTDTAVLFTENPAGGQEVRMVDLRTGTSLWSQPAAAPVGTSVASRYLVVLGNDATVLDLTDGSVLATAELGALAPSGPGGSSFDQIGDRLYVTSLGDMRAMTALRLPELTRVWRIGSAPPGMVTGCGPDVCVETEHGMSLIDGADGRVRWSDPVWSPEYPLVEGALPGLRGLPVHDLGENPRHALLDRATGRLIAETGRLTPAGRTLVRTDRVIPGRTWFQIVRPDGGLRTVGSLDETPLPTCDGLADYVACPTAGGELRVWRTPR